MTRINKYIVTFEVLSEGPIDAHKLRKQVYDLMYPNGQIFSNFRCVWVKAVKRMM